MKKFIDINRLDYLNPAFVKKEKTFLELQKIHCFFKSSAADFIIENSIARHSKPGTPALCAVLRLFFCNVWEWHIADEVYKFLENFIAQAPENSSPCDCIWLLKVAEKKRIPVYFCDIAFFWTKSQNNCGWPESLEWKMKKTEFIEKMQLLIPPQCTDNQWNYIKKLTRISEKEKIIQCKFACDWLR